MDEAEEEVKVLQGQLNEMTNELEESTKIILEHQSLSKLKMNYFSFDSFLSSVESLEAERDTLHEQLEQLKYCSMNNNDQIKELHQKLENIERSHQKEKAHLTRSHESDIISLTKVSHELEKTLERTMGNLNDREKELNILKELHQSKADTVIDLTSQVIALKDQITV